MLLHHRTEDLCTALDNGQIVPYFQPIVELKTRRIRGFEVLARRTRVAGAPTLPVDMILLAEEVGLIGRITETLLRQTAVVARRVPKELRFAINISPSQFCDESFALNLLALMEEIGLSPLQLTIEITESGLLDNFDLALTVSEQLKSYGVQLALDDFGTGYSSLRHLQALPFDELKIDGSFVRSMSDDRASRKIVATIIGLSHSMGMTAVAEGIETVEQAEMLFYFGCGRGQGWLFRHPLPASEVALYLEQSSDQGAVLPSSTSEIGTMIGATLEVLPAQRLSQLQAIYDGAPAALCFLDRNLRYISLNKRFTEVHGLLGIEAFLGRTVAEVVPKHHAAVEIYLLRALAGEASRGLEVSLPDPRHPEQMKTYLVSYEPARDEVGEVVGISCIAVEITERKQAENALRTSIEHYWLAAGTSPQIAWTAEANGDLLDVSPRWEILTGFTLEDFLSNSWIESVHQEDRGRVIELWQRSVQKEAPLDMLFRLLTKNEQWLWLRASGAPRRGTDDRVLRWYGTIEVIDARRTTEQKLTGWS